VDAKSREWWNHPFNPSSHEMRIMSLNDKVKETVWRLALYNAHHHDGRAQAGPVLGKVLAESPELKANIPPVLQVIHSIVAEVNRLSPTEQTQRLEEKWPTLLSEKKAKPEEKQLPPLPNAAKYALIHLRFCPNPDGALHLGGCRAVVLDDEYAKMYNGQLTLRFDDTDPRTKSPLREAYDWIREDLEWLGVTWHNEVYQSDRMDVYYSYAKHLIESSFAYVCTCTPSTFRRLVLEHTACPCRDLPPEDHLSRWNRMLDGSYREGDAVVRIKTDLQDSNPAVRDWPALRIIDVTKYPHPRVGDTYRVWPLFAFCCGIDDHELGISHILRGKEHVTNSKRVDFLYGYLGWRQPEAIHYGRLKIMGTVLSKSKIRKGIREGAYSGWADPRLGTLKALRQRGFLPETIRQFIMELGPKPVDVKVSWGNLEAINRKRLDPLVDRFFFVPNPITLVITHVDKPYQPRLRLHPNYPEKGYRIFTVSPRNNMVSLRVSRNDLPLLRKGQIVRLMGLFNIRVTEVQGEVTAEHSGESYRDAREVGAPLIHWLPHSTGVKAAVVLPDATVVEGIAEDQCKTLRPGEIIQFERFGFVRIAEVNDHILAYFAHR
jgi:glutamyl-tRNA synthetase